MPRRLPPGWRGDWLVGVGVGLLVALVDRVERDAGQVLLVVTAAAAEELARLRGWTTPVPADPGGAIVAVGPALLGAYLGAYLGMVVGRPRTGRPPERPPRRQAR